MLQSVGLHLVPGCETRPDLPAAEGSLLQTAGQRHRWKIRQH